MSNLELMKKQQREYHREYYSRNKEREKARVTKYKQTHKDYYRIISQRYRLRNKVFVIKYYTDGKNCCACCGEKEFNFLTIDHINNDGAKHRKIQGVGSHMYWWLLKNHLPDGFQILCWNCNCAKAYFGKCPHQIKREENIIIV